MAQYFSWPRRATFRAGRGLAVAVAVLLGAGLLPGGAQAAPGGAVPGGATPVERLAAGTAGPSGRQQGERPGDFDARRDGAARQILAERRASLSTRPPAALRSLRASLGRQGTVEIDPLTATPRLVARLDGFLTGPSDRPAGEVALDYARQHASALGLSASGVAALVLRQEYVDVAGTRHLSFVQQAGGVPVFGNGLKAHVSADGRLIQLDGSPLARPPAGPAEPARLTAEQARDAAVADLHGQSRTRVSGRELGPAQQTTFASGDEAQLVIFQTLAGPRLAWQTITLAEGHLHVLDAQTGRVLYRRDLAARDSGLVWANYAGAPRGGRQQRRDLTIRGWLPANSPRLAGNVAHVYTDVNDNDLAEPAEEVAPGRPRRFDYPFDDFTAEVGQPCAAGFQCSWNPQVPYSWRANREQNAAQLFYFLGTFHDHLRSRPIGFTRAAGNFEAVDGDAVQAQAMDGADTAGGLPDANHVDNANMTTPPDGIPPRMQMYLFHTPGDGTDPFLASNSADTADIVYHEYTHGLSNRLVTDAAGRSTLGTVQAAALGEGWSDWYAMDYLVGSGLQEDTPQPGEVRMGKSVTGGTSIRTAGLDCPVGVAGGAGSAAPGCDERGGYTYGDFGRVIAGVQPHADGEIWGETLWDLRTALGSRLTRSLVTRAMELSPANPSYLDMRNSILRADLVLNRGRHRARIWQVFAGRGMGFFAAALDGDDSRPAEDFSLPPAPGTPLGAVTGRVTDVDTGQPVAGAVVGFGGHASGFAGDYAATTAADGSYTIGGIPPGSYAKVFARGPGYDVVTRTVAVLPLQPATTPAPARPASAASPPEPAPVQAQVLDWSVRRNWASVSGGGQVVDASGADNTAFGCGPAALFNLSQGSGWSTDAQYDAAGVMQPRSVTLRLPQPVTITELSINPSGTCGDSASAGTSRYRLETSTDGMAWSEANAGNFGLAHRNRMNRVPLAAGTGSGVRYVRYTMLSTQVEDMAATCPGPYSGCLFVDSVELAIYGTAG